MQIQLFLKNNLAIHFYYSEESMKNGKILVENLYLIFSGLPQFLEKDFFKDKVSKKIAFMSVYYYGSYYSGDTFSFANCQKSVRDAITFADIGQGIKTYDNKEIKWFAKSISVVGNSFGANPILTSSINKKNVDKVILISPLVFIYKNDVVKVFSKKNIKEFKKFNNGFLGFMQRGYKNIYRGIEKDGWRKYFNGNIASSRICLKNDFPPIVVIHGENDRVVNYKNSIFFRDMYDGKIRLNLVKGVGHDFKTLFRASLQKILNSL